jgi:Zn-finger nucleic acid-binding protein
MLVECPGCRNRYDVTGRPPGTRARCGGCGALFELPAPTGPTGQAAMLACPRCDGQVSATNHACEFCAVELLVMACPRCFSRMFHGAKHCSRCGVQVVAPACADTRGQAEQRMCPRCPKTPLVARLIDEVMFDDCPSCGGTFIDANALERILSERRGQHELSILSDLAPPGRRVRADGSAVLPDPSANESAAVYVKCPDCHHLMNRKKFASGVRVIVDICRAHGTWFDKDELAHVIEFAASGGLERAREREREELEQELIALRKSGTAYRSPPRPFGRPTLSTRSAELFYALNSYLKR